jgi:release factor glutamine methyltransferase
VAVDESDGALAVARRNALKHRLTAVSFVRSNWYDQLDASLAHRVNLIVANPPYVGEVEFAELDPVLHHEPRGALVSDDAAGAAGFADLAVVIEGAARWLAPGGSLVVEHGSTQGAPSRAAAQRGGFEQCRTLRDLVGLERILVARRST